MIIFIETNIIIKTQFEAIHYWKGCTIDSVEFLKYPHRHIFYVTIKFPVEHLDRDKEFISIKREIDYFISEQYTGKNIGSKSCEMIGVELLKKFSDAKYVSVFEDNENGAELIRKGINKK